MWCSLLGFDGACLVVSFQFSRAISKGFNSAPSPISRFFLILVERFEWFGIECVGFQLRVLHGHCQVR